VRLDRRRLRKFPQGRHGFEPKAIVIHIIVGSLQSAGLTFRDPHSSVSAHYGVGKSGSVHQFVQETDTAFHAGIVVRPTWKLIDPAVNPNFYTVGIEHEGQPQDVWPDVQYRTSAALVREIAGRWKIPLDRDHIIMHREIRASKTCPGSADVDRIVREAAGGVT
jgi:N-acetylmuramoyl-L-alanine amidase